MTNYYKCPPYSQRHKDLNWINSLTAIHDLHCGCNYPLQHTITGIIKQEPTLKFNKEDSDLIKKCLTTGDPGTEDVVDGFGDGELEKLFEGDFGEEDTTG